MSDNNSTHQPDPEQQTDAEEYVEELACSEDNFKGNYIFQDIEVPDTVAGRLKADPRVKIVAAEKGDFGMDMGTMIVSFKINTPNTDDNEHLPPLDSNGKGLIRALEHTDAHEDLIEYVNLCRENGELTGLLESLHTFHQGGDGNVNQFNSLGTKKEVVLWEEGAREALNKVGNWDVTNKPILETVVDENYKNKQE